MKNINLKETKIYWTTCDKFKDRHEKINGMLDTLSLTGEKVTGPITNPYTIGVAKGYIEALTRSNPPFLILEDDVDLINKNFDPSILINFPDDADALYLGTSLFGRLQNRTVFNGVISARVDDSIIRIFNMLAFHAVLYINQSYINHIIATLNEFIQNPIGGADDPIADSMWKYNVYSLINPIFYQNDGRSEEATKTRLNILL